MLEKISRNWWMYAVRGVVAIIFGVVAFARPEQALQALVLVFGAYALVDGIFAMIAGIASHRYFERWWAVLLEGVAGVVIGLLTFSWPGMGRLFVDAATRFDYSVVMGIVAAIAFLVVMSNLLADVVYAILDPRITYS